MDKEVERFNKCKRTVMKQRQCFDCVLKLLCDDPQKEGQPVSPVVDGELGLTDKDLLEAWENTFEQAVYFDHQPTADEIITIRLRAVAQAQVKDCQRQIGRGKDG